jgi:D-alanyl-D-alanine carboxypeptidase/D-alanyl-D-alanine-endopeptidase (penicillin-binding protein 4)
VPSITALGGSGRVATLARHAAAVLLLAAGATSPAPQPPAVTPPAVSLPAVTLPLPGAVLPGTPATVLPALGAAAPVPTASGVSAVLGGLLTRPALGRSVSAEVLDAASGASLYSLQPGRAAIPASATKILTAAAALSALGPHATLPTRAVLGGTTGEVVLVGGGDVMLSPDAGHPDAVQGRAGLADLAAATATALRARRAASVTVRLDDTLFSGPAVNPAWSRGDVGGGFVAPIMPIELTVGVTTPGTAPRPGLPAARLSDPALAAARRFATLLGAQGITVTGPVTRAAAPAGATVLAEVRSASLAGIVEHDLTDSDNTTAEVLARLVAIAAGQPATFEAGGAAVLARIAALGVPVAGARLAGGSGLGTQTVAPARTIVRTIALAASAAHPELRAVVTGLPVAGASGTLFDRFAGAAAARGAGVVRAKTGTLTGVGALAGVLVDADGRLLAFTLIADAVPATDPGRAALDAAATALAGCGCH